jgi:hypothetical protein
MAGCRLGSEVKNGYEEIVPEARETAFHEKGSS